MDFQVSCQSTNSWYFSAIMGRNTSLSLGDHFAEFIDEQIASTITYAPGKWTMKQIVG